MKAKQPKFSIIIPIYNTPEDCLVDCFSSIKAQDTTEAYEVILVDDGSEQDTAIFCDEYVKGLSNWYVVHQDNRGLAGARNTGINQSRGEYLVFVDSDDKLDKTLLKKISSKVNKLKSDVVYYSFTFWQDFGQKSQWEHTMNLANIPSRETFTVKDIAEHSRFLTFPISACTACVRRDFLKESNIKFDSDLIRCEDYPYSIKVITKARKISYISEGLYFYRQSEFQTLSKGAKNIEFLIYALDRIHQYLVSNELWPIYKIEYYGLMLRYLPHATMFYKVNNEYVNAASGLLVKTKTLDYFLKDSNHAREKRIMNALIKKNKFIIAFFHYISQPVLFWRLINRLYEYAKRLVKVVYRTARALFQVSEKIVTVGSLKSLFANSNYLFFIDHMASGGAEKVHRDFMSAVLRIDKTAKIGLVITYSKANIAESVRLNPRINIFQLKNDKMSNWHIRLLKKLIIKYKPKTMHAAISGMAFQLINDHGIEIKQHTNIFISDYAFFPDASGEQTSYVKIYGNMIKHIKRVITDNDLHKSRLIRTLNYSPSKISVFHMPVRIKPRKHTPKPLHRPLSILWAARIDIDKRPDIPLKIAKELKRQNILAQIDVYGDSTFNSNEDVFDEIKQSKDVRYKGPFSGGLQSLPVSKYDVYLLTSPNEGMPNSVLEAMGLGLIVIASPAGGIPHLIKDGENGFLVKAYDDIDDYIEKIKKISLLPSAKIESIQKLSIKTIVERHSEKQFDDMLKKEKGYIHDC